MRLALLSALAEPGGHAGASEKERPAFRRFAGKTVLLHQIDCAAHLGCERVLCLAGTTGPDLGAAKAYAERAGVRFDAVDSLLRLTGLITADNEVIVIADGVLPDRTVLVGALAERLAVLAFPADPALELGFERIDAVCAWSGALRMRGDGVARLADLPADCDLASSLLRIALQAGTRIVKLDAVSLAEGTWQRRVERHAGADAEWRWIRRQVQVAPFSAPGLALAERLALRWVHDAGGGRWARVPHVAALLTGVLAFGAALASWPLPGLALLLAASIGLAVADIVERVDRLGAPPRRAALALPAAGWLRDGLLIALLALPISAEPGWLRAFLPLVLIALLRMGEVTADARVRALFGDRIVLLAVLLAAAIQGWSAPAVAGLALLALAAQLWAAHSPQAQLTAD